MANKKEKREREIAACLRTQILIVRLTIIEYNLVEREEAVSVA